MATRAADPPPLAWHEGLLPDRLLVGAALVLLRRKSDTRHRLLGYAWVAAMFGTAVLSFFVRRPDDGSASFMSCRYGRRSRCR